MSRSAFALILALLVPLAAAEGAFGSVEDFARALGMKRGGWHTSFKLTAFNFEPRPGTDPAAVAAIERQVAAAKPDYVEETDECTAVAPARPRFPGILLQKECSLSRMEAGKGEWSAESSCPHRGTGGIARIVAKGSYGPETVTGRHVMTLAIDGGTLHVHGETVSRFTGRCRFPPPVVWNPAPKRD